MIHNGIGILQIGLIGNGSVYYFTVQDQITFNALNEQNTLLKELVKAQWVETCYAPKPNDYYGNHTAWVSECTKAGYPVE